MWSDKQQQQQQKRKEKKLQVRCSYWITHQSPIQRFKNRLFFSPCCHGCEGYTKGLYRLSLHCPESKLTRETNQTGPNRKDKLIYLTFSFLVSAESPWNSLLSSKWSGKSLKHTKTCTNKCLEVLQWQSNRQMHWYAAMGLQICHWQTHTSLKDRKTNSKLQTAFLLPFTNFFLKGSYLESDDGEVDNDFS